MREKQILPVAVIGLTAMLVAVVALWTLDRVEGTSVTAVSGSGPVDVIEWKLVTTWPKGLPGLGAAPENFARRVNEASGGRLRIKVFGAGEIVPAFEVFDAVSRGVAEAGHGASYYWKGKIPASVFYTAVPFGMTAQEANGWLHYGGGLELWRELYAPFGVVPFAGGSTGVQMAGWFNIRLNDRTDLDGLKMRIPGLAGEVFDAAGGSAVRIAGGEVYTSMQTGVIDAVEWVGPYNDRTLGLMEVGEYYYYPDGTSRVRCSRPSLTLTHWLRYRRICRRLCRLPLGLRTPTCSTTSPLTTVNRYRFCCANSTLKSCPYQMMSWTLYTKAVRWRFKRS